MMSLWNYVSNVYWSTEHEYPQHSLDLLLSISSTQRQFL